MTQQNDEMDIHNIRRRYESALRNLLDHKEIPEENKQKIQQFLQHLAAQDLSSARRLFYLQRLTIVGATLGRRLLTHMTRKDIEGILCQLSVREGETVNK